MDGRVWDIFQISLFIYHNCPGHFLGNSFFVYYNPDGTFEKRDGPKTSWNCKIYTPDPGQTNLHTVFWVLSKIFWRTPKSKIPYFQLKGWVKKCLGKNRKYCVQISLHWGLISSENIFWGLAQKNREEIDLENFLLIKKNFWTFLGIPLHDVMMG